MDSVLPRSESSSLAGEVLGLQLLEFGGVFTVHATAEGAVNERMAGVAVLEVIDRLGSSLNEVLDEVVQGPVGNTMGGSRHPGDGNPDLQ
jgi:hypothetical protein